MAAASSVLPAAPGPRVTGMDDFTWYRVAACSAIRPHHRRKGVPATGPFFPTVLGRSDRAPTFSQ